MELSATVSPNNWVWGTSISAFIPFGLAVIIVAEIIQHGARMREELDTVV